VDAEAVARDLERLAARLGGDVSEADRSCLRDQLGVLAGRCQWIADAGPREFVQRRVDELWQQVGEPS
jgi:MoxR-like ATPase